MAASPGRLGTVEVSTDGGTTYLAVGLISDFQFAFPNDPIDTTTFDDQGNKSEDYGESQCVVDVTMNLDESDAGQDALREASDTKVKRDFRVRRVVGAGLREYTFNGVVRNFNTGNSRNAVVSATAQIASSGVVTVAAQA